MRISDWSLDVCSSDLGRGRRGRTWVSEPGNLYASTLIRLRGGDPPAQQLGFVAALALHRALSAWAPAARLSLKWPNDLLMDGAKLSGILLEREGDAEIAGLVRKGGVWGKRVSVRGDLGGRR